VKLSNRITPNQKKFIAEVIGTFIVVVFATGAVVIDSKMHGILGISFIAFAPFVGIAIAVYMFGKISMAHGVFALDSAALVLPMQKALLSLLQYHLMRRDLH